MYHKGGYKVDTYGFSMINATCKLKTNKLYILAPQAEQVYYVRNIKESNWQVVVKTMPRDFYDISDDDIRDEQCQENENFRFTIHSSTIGDANNVTKEIH